MRNFLPLWSTLFLILLMPVAVAKEREPVSRNLYLSDDPREEVRPVYVAGEMTTVLGFQQPCDRAGTKMLGWEGRFEPVECAGTKVLIAPLKDLGPEDRFLLLVTLADGKELPFTVTAREGWFDHQVNVFPNNEAPETLQSRLEQTRARNQILEQENGRLRNEESSIDHALAALLARDAGRMTPFRPEYVHLFKNPYGVEIRITVLASKKHDKVAVVFNVRNNSPAASWSLLDARLVAEASGEKRPFALRATREYWGPGGESGQIAVVLDANAFDSKTGPERLVLELFRRGSGLREALVTLDPRMLR
jgi:uncharacterized protein (TIGR02268 family)